MKRSSDEQDATHEIPSLPPELWDRVISQPLHTIDTKTVSSVFFLDKTISTYLSHNSKQVMKRVLALKLNKLCSEEVDNGRNDWFRCYECSKIIFAIPCNQKFINQYCGNCARECLGCGQLYTRDFRYCHRECEQYPAPFTPHDSDYDSPYHEDGEVAEYYENEISQDYEEMGIGGIPGTL